MEDLGDILYTTYVFLGDYSDRGPHSLEAPPRRPRRGRSARFGLISSIRLILGLFSRERWVSSVSVDWWAVG